VQIPAPPGCARVSVAVNIEAAATRLEMMFQGTLRTRVANGGGNCLNPSEGELRETEVGELEGSGGRAAPLFSWLAHDGGSPSTYPSQAGTTRGSNVGLGLPTSR
jgi:hypothetical protein